VDGQTSLKILAVVRSEIASLRMLFVKRVVMIVQIEKSAKTFCFTCFISNVAMRTKSRSKRPDCRSFLRCLIFGTRPILVDFPKFLVLENQQFIPKIYQDFQSLGFSRILVKLADLSFASRAGGRGCDRGGSSPRRATSVSWSQHKVSLGS